MLVKVKRGWEIPESEATPEAAFLNRRNLLKAMGMGSLAAAAGALLPARAAFAEDAADPSAGLYPAKRDEKYTLDRPITDEKLVTHYNNFYEYGEDKDIADRAQQLKSRSTAWWKSRRPSASTIS
jgi:sulfoxide reductase catalytic subunit YedY